MILPSQAVLVATDLSARADRAIDRAVMLGRQLSRPVVAVHVVASGGADFEDAAQRLRRVLPDGGAGIQMLVAEGSPPEEIAIIADEQDAAVVCTGVARFNSIGDFLLGTAVDVLCRNLNRPLLVVKERPWAPYDVIVFPTDFSACARTALLQALKLFPQASFRLIHAFHVPYAAWNKDAYVKEDLERDCRSKMDEFIAGLEAEAGSRLQGTIAEGNLVSAASALAEEVGANLVAFGTHGEGGVRKATMGSMATELLNHLPMDSLIINVGD